jgi:hypothetical protein
MNAHTPGPWYVGVYAAHESVFVDSGDGCIYIATTASRDVPSQQRHANARLIAAAPDMYEALKAMLDPNECTRDVDLAIAALHKAEGHS